ncbi:hypothetical protein [Rhodobacter sp. NSM]|uniref:hypothetical protein n=1 Tax=Rhodobacter sp. NSM TaxID=3457501 RepID=UPI003FCFCA83
MRTIVASFAKMPMTPARLCDISSAILGEGGADLGVGVGRAAMIVTVSTDGERDTPAALAEAAETVGASGDWLWLTGAPRGTGPLLDARRFPPGTIESHDPTSLVGQPCLGRFTREIGPADPDSLIALARAQLSGAEGITDARPGSLRKGLDVTGRPAAGRRRASASRASPERRA